MWARYIDEMDNFRKVLILKKIITTQPYLSSYYEATKYVVDNRNEKIGLMQDHRTSKPQQRNSSLIDIDSHKITNSYDNKSSIRCLNIAKEEEIDKKVFDKYNHDKNNFVV